MSFDTDRYMGTPFDPRTEDVPVPELADYFDEGETPVWTVRGLSGQEIGLAAEAMDRSKNIQAVVDGLFSSARADMRNAVGQLVGIDRVIPLDVVKRLDMLVRGSVSPKITDETAKRICRDFGVRFWELTNKILELTGQGYVPGKVPPSGVTEKSEAA